MLGLLKSSAHSQLIAATYHTHSDSGISRCRLLQMSVHECSVEMISVVVVGPCNKLGPGKVDGVHTGEDRRQLECEQYLPHCN